MHKPLPFPLSRLECPPFTHNLLSKPTSFNSLFPLLFMLAREKSRIVNHIILVSACFKSCKQHQQLLLKYLTRQSHDMTKNFTLRTTQSGVIISLFALSEPSLLPSPTHFSKKSKEDLEPHSRG